MTFGSVITAMVTPFSADGSVDFGRVGPLVDRLLELGNDGLVINGTTGESATVDDDEKNELLREVVLSVSGRAKVCLLYTSPSPRDLSTSRMPSSA